MDGSGWDGVEPPWLSAQAESGDHFWPGKGTRGAGQPVSWAAPRGRSWFIWELIQEAPVGEWEVRQGIQ